MSKISGIFSLRNFVAKQLMKVSDEGIMSLPDKGKIDFGEMMIKENLFQRGIDSNTIKNEKQLENILNTPFPTTTKSTKKSGEVIEVDFDKGKWKDTEPEKFFYGGFVEQPELGPTAHGSEALASRTRLSAPGSTSTTSTGLNYLLAEDNDNQRVPFKLGGIDKGRRAFLKLMGGAAAGIGALKAGALKLFGKEGATVAKEVITTPAAPGKPAWFDPLVTRIINEGEDVTKQFAYKERMRVHTKPISETEEVTVYRDLDDGSVRVNYGSKLKIDETKPYERGNIQRASNDSDQVDLIVRQGEEIEPDLATGKGGGKTKASFEASEAEPRAAGGPEDADIEFDGIREVENVDDLMQDVSSLEEFATGKKLTGDKAAKAKKKREDYQRFTEDQVEQANYLEEKYGPYDDSAMDDFASGGRVPLFKGKIVKGIMSLGKKKKTSAVNEAYKKQRRRLEGYLGSLDRNAPDFQEAANITIKKLEKLERDYKAGKFVPEGQVIDDTIVVDDDFGSAMAEWARKNDPEGYAKIQKVVDEANQQLELQRFKTKGRKPNASGGLANMLGE